MLSNMLYFSPAGTVVLAAVIGALVAVYIKEKDVIISYNQKDKGFCKFIKRLGNAFIMAILSMVIIMVIVFVIDSLIQLF